MTPLVPDPDRQFVVEVDTSDVGVGAVLSQRSAKDQKLHPCAFFRRLSPAERNYDISNRELLAVKLALEEWRHWLEGTKSPFLVWTDHNNLEYIRSAKRLNSRQASSSVVSGRKHVNGVDLYYKQTGRGKHAVLLFPGVFDCTQTCFKPQRESLSKERFTLVAWDPRGYGRSRPPARDFPPDFLERDAQDGVDLMKALGFDKLSLLGWSAGGTTALIAAAKNPDLIRQMVVLGAFPMITQLDRQRFEEVHDVNRADQRLRAHLEAIYGEEEFLRIWGAFLKGTAKFAERPQGSICLELLPLIRCPTLIINGDNDSVCPLYHPHALLKNIKGSRFHLVPGGRHNLHLTHPDLFNKLVEDFLED